MLPSTSTGRWMYGLGTGRLAPQVVAVHGHVEGANWSLDAFHFVHHRREPVGQRDPRVGIPHRHQILCTAVRLENLVGHAHATRAI